MNCSPYIVISPCCSEFKTNTTNATNTTNTTNESSMDARAGWSAASPGALMQVGASIPCPYGYGCYPPFLYGHYPWYMYYD